MLADILRDGFALTHRRLGLIFLDVLWRAVWLAATLALSLAVAGWFANQVGSIVWQGPTEPGLNGLVAAVALRQLWNEHAAGMLWSVVALMVTSAFLWIILEAFSRVRIMASLRTPPNLGGEFQMFNTFKIYIISKIAKISILGAVGLTFGLIVFGRYLTTPLAEWPALWPETRDGIIISVVALLGLAFVVTILDTLVRSDAVDLFGTDLIRVSGVIGILLIFEALIGASIAIIIVAGFLNVGNVADGIAMLALASAGVLLLSLLHSYLLLVRFSAVGIMRHNVVEI